VCRIHPAKQKQPREEFALTPFWSDPHSLSDLDAPAGDSTHETPPRPGVALPLLPPSPVPYEHAGDGTARSRAAPGVADDIRCASSLSVLLICPIINLALRACTKSGSHPACSIWSMIQYQFAVASEPPSGWFKKSPPAQKCSDARSSAAKAAREEPRIVDCRDAQHSPEQSSLRPVLHPPLPSRSKRAAVKRRKPHQKTIAVFGLWHPRRILGLRLFVHRARLPHREGLVRPLLVVRSSKTIEHGLLRLLVRRRPATPSLASTLRASVRAVHPGAGLGRFPARQLQKILGKPTVGTADKFSYFKMTPIKTSPTDLKKIRSQNPSMPVQGDRQR
jgi:hypothetical protein